MSARTGVAQVGLVASRGVGDVFGRHLVYEGVVGGHGVGRVLSYTITKRFWIIKSISGEWDERDFQNACVRVPTYTASWST